MICDILFLYARDSEQIKEDLLQQLRGVCAHCICVDDPEFSCQETLKNITQVKLQVVFFSPGFLNFLECRVQEAYEYFCNFDPQATVALFCCGLLERMIFCYHTAPLKSYSSWPKYEHMDGQVEGSAFSPYFMGMFEEFLPDQNRAQESVLIVPGLINKESSSVYIVFSEAIENLEEFTVHLEAGSKIQIAPECINEYMLYFNVPVTVLDSRESIDVQIKQSGKVIAAKDLKIVHSADSNEWRNTVDMTKEIIKLRRVQEDSEDLLYSNYTRSNRSSQENLCTISPQHTSSDMTDLYKKYEDRNTFSGHMVDANEPYFLMKNSSSEQVNGLDETDDTYGFPVVYRSVSLPSIIPQPEGYYNLDPVYMAMTAIHHNTSPNLCRSTSNSSLNDSCSYVSMRFNGNTPPRVFGGSQQDIMQTFKNGNLCYEKENKARRRRPVESPNSSGNDEQAAIRFAGKRAIRRTKQLTTDTDSEMGSKRSSFNDSASSSSSKASENSNCTVQSWKFSGSPKATDEVSTNAFPNYQAARTSPVNNESKPQLRNEDSSLYRIRYPNQNSKLSKPARFSARQSIKRDYEDKEKVESLIKVCERYGLQHLGDYYISGCPDNVDVMKDYSPDTDEGDNFNIERFEISGGFEVSDEWAQDNIPSLQRSISLPSTLFPTDPVILLDENFDDSYDDVRYPDDENESLTCSCEGYINALPSGIYMSLIQDANRDEPQNSGCPIDTLKSVKDHCSYASGIYMSLLPHGDANETVQSCAPSNSQEELLSLMGEYKRGEKTISQVEQQFQQWHIRHMTIPSKRDQQLLTLRDEYERAQKPSKSRLKELILRKPKPGRKKTSDESGRSQKKKVRKTSSDTKRLSKISAASNSSGGTSDNGDFIKYCYDNPGYIGTQSVRRNFKPFCPPPPLPPRPPLTPIAVMRTLVFDQKSQSSEDEKSPSKSQSESPQIGKQKPSPPPKPKDVFKKLSCERTAVGNENQPKTKEEPGPENEENRPESPDYIIPNIVRRIPSRKKRLIPPNPHCPLHSPTPGIHFYPKQPQEPSSCPSTLDSSRKSDKNSHKRLSWNLLLKDTIPNPFAGIARTKKVEMSKFYVTRKWSSFPRLDSSQFHTYLELQEFWDDRNKLINNSPNPVD